MESGNSRFAQCTRMELALEMRRACLTRDCGKCASMSVSQKTTLAESCALRTHCSYTDAICAGA